MQTKNKCKHRSNAEEEPGKQRKAKHPFGCEALTNRAAKVDVMDKWTTL
jgi:hypothetical protein